jgi:hypothetical protein
VAFFPFSCERARRADADGAKMAAYKGWRIVGVTDTCDMTPFKSGCCPKLASSVLVCWQGCPNFDLTTIASYDFAAVALASHARNVRWRIICAGLRYLLLR